MDRLCEFVRQECAGVRFGIRTFQVFIEAGKIVEAKVVQEKRVRYEEMPEPAEAVKKT